MSDSYPITFPKDGKALVKLEKLSAPKTGAPIYTLEHVEKAWDDQDEQKIGAALVTTAQVEATSKFYSNGLDFEAAISDPEFFDKYLNPVYEKFLSFPIPTIASAGGHAFAAGFGLIMSHDYRVFNGQKGFMCMNEIDFGAQIPPGLYAALESKKLPLNVMRKIVLEGHRFGAAEAFNERIIDVISPKPEEKVDNGPAKTLETSIELAIRLAPKAGKDAYGSNKLVMHAPFLATLREKNEDALAKL